jgi:hypothetical protein
MNLFAALALGLLVSAVGVSLDSFPDCPLITEIVNVTLPMPKHLFYVPLNLSYMNTATLGPMSTAALRCAVVCSPYASCCCIFGFHECLYRPFGRILKPILSICTLGVTGKSLILLELKHQCIFLGTINTIIVSVTASKPL